MKTEDFLEPCPFCGGEAELHYYEGSDMICVMCIDGCCASSRLSRDDDETIEAWNKRAPIANAQLLEVEIQRLRAALEEIRKPATIIGFGRKATGKMRLEQLESDHVRVRTIAANALNPKEEPNHD